ncbi:hypothetical protein CJ030_MR0G022802 [Morella rubra]|uniref:Abnormal spindle-like microcephaly-associated protein n=1 Tax=Morella rubra TaxID=262757 RepID=A0A6A1UGV6_9ROSI|nr:hypothetical protein CJ030_MR0G022802 [Morella rubra]
MQPWRLIQTLTSITCLPNHAERWKQSKRSGRYLMFIADRHNFVKLKRSVLLIQRAARAWINRRHQGASIENGVTSPLDQVQAAIIDEKSTCGWLSRPGNINGVAQLGKAPNLHEDKGSSDLQTKAVAKIQCAWKIFIICRSLLNQHFAATKIQSCFLGWVSRKRFQNQRQATIKIQSIFRMRRCWRAHRQYQITTISATLIQILCAWMDCLGGASRHRRLMIAIQRHCRGWLIRRNFLLQREAATKIQSAVRCLICWKAFQCQRGAVIQLQKFIRGHISRNRLLGASSLCAVTRSGCLSSSRGCFNSVDLELFLCSVLKLQRWWKGASLLKLRTKAAVTIQSHIRVCLARRNAAREKHRIVVIQSYWKGYLTRKELRGRLLDLRFRVQKSSTNVDDARRIINRLLAALSELLSMRSVSGILHTCATLDMATEHSQRCCEELVAAGAINALLTLISSVSRSIPDQAVRKHALLTLRNLARYPHLVEALIDSHGSVETILWEFLRSKEDGYFIASELLKKICSTRKGVEAMRKLPTHLKRLQNLVEELTRKAINEKRNTRGPAARENVERRLREAVLVLKAARNATSLPMDA